MKAQHVPNASDESRQQTFLTIQEAGAILRMSRNSAYAAAKHYRDTGGAKGLPNITIAGIYRVPVAAIERMTEVAIPS